MEDKRKYSRLKSDIRSEVHFEDGMTYSKSVDMSNGGLFISTPEPLSEGSEVSLSLQIPGEDPVDIKGVVKWIRDSDDEHKAGMGIEFKDATDNDLDSIKKIIG